MAIYTKIGASEIQEIAKLYAIKVEKITPISGGNCNSNYKIQDHKSSYILTIAEEQSEAEIDNMAQLLRWLKMYNIACPEVCETIDKKLVINYNDKPIFIKKWIEGDILTQPTAAILEQIGIAMAKMHQIPHPNFLAPHQLYNFDKLLTYTNKNIDTSYETWLKNRCLFLQQKLPQNPPKGVIHGDLFFDNVLLEKDNFVAIIDFEDASFGAFAFDIGMAFVGLCKKENRLDIALAKAFLRGYETIRKLEDSERASLSLFAEYAALGTSWWRFWRYNIFSPMPHLKQKHREMAMLAQWIEGHKIQW